MTGDRTRRTYLSTLAATTLAALAGCGGGDGGDDGDGGDGGAPDAYVEMTDDLVYDPETIEVAAGTTVTWETVGVNPHTVTAYDDQLPDGADYFASGGFDSESAARSGYPQAGNVEEGETYEHTFETPGDYGYFCIPHESAGMVGTVRVT